MYHVRGSFYFPPNYKVESRVYCSIFTSFILHSASSDTVSYMKSLKENVFQGWLTIKTSILVAISSTDFVFFKPLRDNELVGKDSAEMLHTVTCSIYY